jgi:hypothetical protein
MAARINKKEREQSERDSRKAKNQSRRSAPNLNRTEASKNQKVKLLIVCDGKNTEPSYFKKFRYATATIEKVDTVGDGTNTLSTVVLAERLKNTKYQEHEVWCVFDADPKGDNPMQLVNFNNAIQKANALGYGVAYSHQAFEYWLILHFEDHQGGAMHRDLYYDKINAHLKSISPKLHYDEDSKLISDALFDVLDGIDTKTGTKRQTLAIKRAIRNYNQFDHSNPAEEESSTTVFRLVNKLLGKEEYSL